MVKSSGYSGDFSINPYNFEHFDASSVRFNVNGEPTPRQPLKLDIGDSDYLQGDSAFRVSGKLMEIQTLV